MNGNLGCLLSFPVGPVGLLGAEEKVHMKEF